MAKSRLQKEEAVKQLTDQFSQAKSAVFVSFAGLKVSDISNFRTECRKNDLSYAVAKKTLINIALKNAKIEGVDLSQFESGIGTVFGLHDEVAPAQIVDKFAKDHQAMTILGGVMTENPEGQKFLSVDQVKALAKLPSKEVLLGRLVGSINAPVSGFVNVLAGNIRGLVNVLSQVKDQRSQS